MEKVSAWILSVVGIVIISLLVDILLPAGKTGKLIKSVLAVFSVFVFISPLRQIDLNSFNFSNLFNDLQIDSSFVEDRNSEKLKAMEKNIEENLSENGYYNTKVTIKAKLTEKDLDIINVFVDLCDLVLKDENLNIDKYTNIMAIVKKIVTVKEDRIVIYE